MKIVHQPTSNATVENKKNGIIYVPAEEDPFGDADARYQLNRRME